MSVAAGHIWSLNIEEHCYVLLAMIASIPLLRAREYLLVLLLGVGALIVHFIYFKMPDIAPVNYDVRTEVAASHLLLSCGYYQIKGYFTRYVRWWMPLAGLILGMACYILSVPWYFMWLFSPMLLAFSVNHLDLLPQALLKVLSFKPLVLMGIWSYSIYLWQQPFYFYGVGHQTIITVSNFLLLAGAVLAGLMSFYLVENPARKWLNAKW
jgi:peptidoglycan/LPS O-acetylase OafA/YrhL